MSNYNHRKYMQETMKRFNLTFPEAIEMEQNRGYYDGINSASMRNPAHKSWPSGSHFNSHYERGYWKGYAKGKGL